MRLYAAVKGSTYSSQIVQAFSICLFVLCITVAELASTYGGAEVPKSERKNDLSVDVIDILLLHRRGFRAPQVSSPYGR